MKRTLFAGAAILAVLESVIYAFGDDDIKLLMPVKK